MSRARLTMSAASGIALTRAVSGTAIAQTTGATSAAVSAAASAVPVPSSPAVRAPAAPVVTAAPPASAPAAAAPAAAALASPASPAVEAPAPAEKEGALVLRPSQPLTLAAEPASTPWIYKLLFVAAVAGAAFVVYKKRRATAGDERGAGVKVVAKTAMGLRGELALVEVGGMRLLVGVTPSSMQTLAVLPDDATFEIEETREAERAPAPAMPGKAIAGAAAAAAPTARAPAKSDLATRARSLFAELEAGTKRKPGAAAFSAPRYKAVEGDDDDDAPESAPAQSPTKAEPRRRTREAPIEGQARGIALALRNGR